VGTDGKGRLVSVVIITMLDPVMHALLCAYRNEPVHGRLKPGRGEQIKAP
jgi:hypothetical protein